MQFNEFRDKIELIKLTLPDCVDMPHKFDVVDEFNRSLSYQLISSKEINIYHYNQNFTLTNIENPSEEVLLLPGNESTKSFKIETFEDMYGQFLMEAESETLTPSL